MAAVREKPASEPDGPAAIAIRDDVSDFEKWGTRAFTQPLLKSAYAESWYFVENRHLEPQGKHRAFVSALRRALARHRAVDIFLLAHSNHYIEWIEELDPPLRSHLRLVYNTGCGDAVQGDRWLALGAKAYVAHPGDNIAPIFYVYFLLHWVSGAQLSDAVATANASTKDEIFNGTTGWVISLLAAHNDRDQAFYWRGTEARIFGRTDVRLDLEPAPPNSIAGAPPTAETSK